MLICEGRHSLANRQRKMNTPTESRTQVVIVGGGPVGLGLAIELGQRGIRCLLVERYVSPQPIPKGQNLTQRTLEHFYFWGAEPELRAARTIPRDYGIGGMTSYGTLLSGYKYDWLQRELVRPYYFTDNERLPQYATEAVLRHRVSQLQSVETVYGWGAESLEQDAHGAQVVIAERKGDRRRVVQADYVVGCDGSRSLVREAAGITQTMSDHDRLMVLLVFRSTGLHKLLERFPNKSFYNVLHPDLKGYWQFFGRVDLGTTWFFHAPVPLGTTKDNFDFRSYLHLAVGEKFDVEFEHTGFWDLRVATADRYRKGRVFIAGDAAHSHPPYGGYGINTGLEDVANLGWKLAAALQGWAAPGLLDSYGEERRPVFASTARDFIEKAIESDKEFLAAFDPAIDKNAFEAEWLARSSGARSEVNSFEPNYEGSSLVAGPPGSVCSAIGSHEFAARAGHHLAPRQLASGRNVFEELGTGFTLIDLGAAESAVAELKRTAEASGVPFRVVRDDSVESREFYKATLILVRPDQFIAWVSDDGAKVPADVISRAVGG
ncbi:MAG: Monooxygenase, FAD-binding protein [Tardiphaga sp.]|nr:Monooxygenase, FAD-binding protein [Tardiphaga sp.]